MMKAAARHVDEELAISDIRQPPPASGELAGLLARQVAEPVYELCCKYLRVMQVAMAI
jgi:hypothetical protein